MTNRKTEGLIAAPFTPLRADGTLNLDAVEHYARWLASRRNSSTLAGTPVSEGMW
jgi:N-acetylneuraminate lyase